MRFSFQILVLAAAVSAAIPAAYGQSNNAGDRYWDADKNGWHFYEPKPVEVVPEPEPEPEPVIEPQVVIQAPPQEPEGPEPLSADWLKVNIPKYQSIAIDNPTRENVELVAYLQRLSMDKAERYSQAMAQVPINNPALDEFARSPITAAQRLAAESTISVAKKRTLAFLSQRLGLYYFYSSTCPYCARQEPILDRLKDRTNFSVLNISLDGGPLASGSPEPFVVNKGHAEQLGVMTTPTLVVADTATGQLHNLAAGLRTISEIETRILQLAKTQRWITDAQYDEAVRGEARMYLTDGIATLDDIEDNPEALLDALRQASYNGGSTPWRIEPQSQEQ